MNSEPSQPDLLHAYWRMDYITEPQRKGGPRGNPFTELPKLEDREALILHRGKTVYLVLNRYPYNAGHLMVLPYREVPTLAELSSEERIELMDTIVLAQKTLTEAMRPDGFNVGFNFGAAAGAGIPRHLHAHIVPRWEGDTNFMPVLGGTRVLPQALEQTWEGLRRALERVLQAAS
jgi:ATP adenylyltransferase